MKSYLTLLVSILFLGMLQGARHALVIGNSEYSEKKLENTINDATDMAAKFKELGFQTVMKTNLDLSVFEAEIDNLVARISPADEVVLYYAGHGVQIEGINYLIPVNARISTEVQCKHRAMSCNYILEALQKASVSILILDACRNNPYAWSRSVGRGLASMEGKAGSQYIIYSTAAGLEADDGSGNNSPFTAALKKHIGSPNLTVEDMMRKVIKEVEALTENKQTPAAYGNLRDRFYFNQTASDVEEEEVPALTSLTKVQALQENSNRTIAPRKPLQTLSDKPGASIIVKSNIEGDVMLDERFQEKISAGSEVRIGGLEPGTYSVTLRGKINSDSKTVVVVKDQEMQLSFVIDSAIHGFIRIEGGSFKMGSASGSSDEKPLHEVLLGTFHLAATELSQADWNEIMAYNPSSIKDDARPVDNVSWYEAILYCNKRSIKEFLTPVYNINGSPDPERWGDVPVSSNSNWVFVRCNTNANGYRLPTEAEWEYAARGGTQQLSFKYSGSDDLEAVAWTATNSEKQICKTGTKLANSLGIFDLSGNVMEWCWDWYDENYYDSSSSENPQGALTGFSRVVRGGGVVNSLSSNFRVAYRHYLKPETRKKGLGFRLVRAIE